MKVEIKKSNQSNKKLMAIFYDNDNKKVKTTHFGSASNKDFTIYSKESKKLADDRKRLYLERHKKNEDWNDFKSAGSLSRYILWNKPTIEASKKSYVNRFNLTLI
jgi:hypothetical protein|tara:strand:- start:415 stop:729 length:315 start_codon:yes stop_codon:yes gene_type:complete